MGIYKSYKITMRSYYKEITKLFFFIHMKPISETDFIIKLFKKGGYYVMNNVFITTSAFGAEAVLEKGQGFYFPIIAGGGAKGVEVRKELFSEKDISLAELRKKIEKGKLICVYSVPLTIWKSDGNLNEKHIILAIREATELGAKFVKFSLGEFNSLKNNIKDLKQLLVKLDIKKNHLQITVENDQTRLGGNVQILNEFLKECLSNGVPIGMTFDIGNWKCTGEDAYGAALILSKYVVYIHCKHVEFKLNQCRTLPLPQESGSEWRRILSILPQDVPLAIEFPISGQSLEQLTNEYVQLLANA